MNVCRRNFMFLTLIFMKMTGRKNHKINCNDLSVPFNGLSKSQKKVLRCSSTFSDVS